MDELRLGEIGVPTLMIAGGRDLVCPPASAAEPTHAALPNSELAMFEEQGLFVETVGGWLDGLG